MIFTLVLLTPLIIIFLLIYYIYFYRPAITNLDHQAWWGPEELKEHQDTTIRPFKIQFSDHMVKDLKTRLQNACSFTPPLEGVAFQYGFNTKELKTWLQYWAEDYDFSRRETVMNKYPQFKTNIQGLDIHFIRVTPKVPEGVEVVPILLLHGWPGSTREFCEAIPYLTSVNEDRDFALEIIAPSLPGFGFSDEAVRPECGAAEIAVIMRNLMRRLGHQKFYLQGGDWGSIICSIMATMFPKEVLGYHTNFPMVVSPKAMLVLSLFACFPSLLVDEDLIERVYPLKKTFAFFLEETGYLHMMATKPDTIGIALQDSPAGLLAFNLEKFSAATNPNFRALPDGGLDHHFTKDQLLDNLMMYWVPKSTITCGRLYAESINKRALNMKWDDIPTGVPTWAIQARHEIVYMPPPVLRLKYKNLIGTTVLQKGGHFLALELPVEYSNDVLNAISEFRKYWRNKSLNY